MKKKVGFVFLLALLIFIDQSSFGQSLDFKSIQKKAEKQGFRSVENDLIELIKTHPEPRIFLYYGSQLGQLKEYQKAKKVLLHAEEKYPENLSIINLAALVHFRLKEYKAAKMLFEKAQTIKSDDSFAQKWLDEISKVLPSSETTLEEGKMSNNAKDEVNFDDGTLPLAKQKELAKKLFREMVDTDYWDIPTFENNYLEVIKRCPDTSQAPISCWKLSNLYLTSLDKPKVDSAIEILEHFVNKYPYSDLMPQVNNRLLYLYRRSNNQEKVIEYLSELLNSPALNTEDYAKYGLLYGSSLEKTGYEAEAKTVYQSILDKAGESKSYSVSVARQRLAR